jgi:hypothetical protein
MDMYVYPITNTRIIINNYNSKCANAGIPGAYGSVEKTTGNILPGPRIVH